jgi:hypothetical protein
MLELGAFKRAFRSNLNTSRYQRVQMDANNIFASIMYTFRLSMIMAMMPKEGPCTFFSQHYVKIVLLGIRQGTRM